MTIVHAAAYAATAVRVIRSTASFLRRYVSPDVHAGADSTTATPTSSGWPSNASFRAPTIETDAISGWEWRDLDRGDAPRDGSRRVPSAGAFLAHWDNKSTNQRLVCLDGLPRHSPQAGRDLSRRDVCVRSPLAMIQDLGASFGPPKVNLARWRDLPIRHDRTSCLVSMRALPFEGATFEDVHISEAGRALAASRLGAISDVQIERMSCRRPFSAVSRRNR